MKRKHFVLAVLAIALVLSASIGTAFAYFTTYSDARGGYVIHLGHKSEIEESWLEGKKEIRIGNKANSADDVGKYPIFVRVKIFAGTDLSLGVPAGVNWVQSGDYYNYLLPLYCALDPSVETNSQTTPLKVEVNAVAGRVYKAGDKADVIVVYESVPAVFLPNGDPDFTTAWATGVITPIIG